MKTLENIRDLFVREFGFRRHHDVTGLVLKKQVEDIPGCVYEEHRYRGISLWLKEIIESMIALGLIGYFVYRIFDVLLFNNSNLLNIQSYANDLLLLSGIALIADSLLLIAALISSPGIDETIDSISVTIGGILLIFIGKNNELFVDNPDLILKVILPLSIIVVILIVTKHALRKANNCGNNCQKEGKGNQTAGK